MCEPEYLIKDLVHEFETPASATFRTNNSTRPEITPHRTRACRLGLGGLGLRWPAHRDSDPVWSWLRDCHEVLEVLCCVLVSRTHAPRVLRLKPIFQSQVGGLVLASSPTDPRSYPRQPPTGLLLWNTHTGAITMGFPVKRLRPPSFECPSSLSFPSIPGRHTSLLSDVALRKHRICTSSSHSILVVTIDSH